MAERREYVPAACSKHPDRKGVFGVVLVSLYESGDQGRWRSMFRHSEPLEAICEDCRLDLLAYLSGSEVEGDSA